MHDARAVPLMQVAAAETEQRARDLRMSLRAALPCLVHVRVHESRARNALAPTVMSRIAELEATARPASDIIKSQVGKF